MISKESEDTDMTNEQIIFNEAVELMKKAKFIRKYYGRGYDRDFVYLDYEYRGHEYTVYENLAKGNEPLSWQHRSEQARIDRLIELENMPKKPFVYEDSADAFSLFLDYVETGDETVFDK